MRRGLKDSGPRHDKIDTGKWEERGEKGQGHGACQMVGAEGGNASKAKLKEELRQKFLTVGSTGGS